MSPTDKAHAHLRAKSLSGGGLASHGGAALSAQHKAQLHKASRLIDAYASCLGTCWLANATPTPNPHNPNLPTHSTHLLHLPT